MDISQHFHPHHHLSLPAAARWAGVSGRGAMSGTKESVCPPMGKEGGGIDGFWGASNIVPKLCSVQDGIRICRWERTDWEQRPTQEVAGFPAGSPPSPCCLRNSGEVVPRHHSPAVPAPGSCCRRKVCGAGSRHSTARHGGEDRGLTGMLGGCYSECRQVCSWDVRECLGNAAQDSWGMLPWMLGGCYPGF